ncbi:protein kinase domain-containing protein [Ditylenchus destructor]|nr:protein kinase domain-containing protein [Ditylenchus destructor]
MQSINGRRPSKLMKPKESESRRDESPKAAKLLKKHKGPPPAGGRYAKNYFFGRIGEKLGLSIVARNGQRTNQKAPSNAPGQREIKYNYAETKNFPAARPRVREGVRRPPKESPVTTKAPGQNYTLPGDSNRTDRRPIQDDRPTLRHKDQKITSGTRPTVIDQPKQKVEKTRPQEPLSRRPEPTNPASGYVPPKTTANVKLQAQPPVAKAPVNRPTPVATRKETPPRNDRNEAPKKVSGPEATSEPASRPPTAAKIQMRDTGPPQRRPTANDSAARASPLAKLPINASGLPQSRPTANTPGPNVPTTKVTGTKTVVKKERGETLPEKPTQEPVTGVTPKRNSWPGGKGTEQETNKPLSLDDFTSLKKLGNGSFGTVYKVEHKPTGKIYAMKVTKMTKKKEVNVANEDEIIMMRYLRSKAFDKMFDFLLEPIAFDSEVGWTTHSDGRREEDLFGKVIPHTKKDGTQVLRVVMPLMDGGDLFDLIRKYGGITEALCRVLITQVIYGVDDLHRVGVMHRDLKLENVMRKSGTARVKVIDFGLGKIGMESSSRAGTARYMAPEVVKNKKYGPEVDWYSIGAMIYTLMVGNYVSFTGEKAHVYIKTAEYGEGKREIEFPEWLELSYDCMDVILKLMHPDPKQRLGNKPESDPTQKGVNQILEHPWFNKYPNTIDRVLDVENDDLSDIWRTELAESIEKRKRDLAMRAVLQKKLEEEQKQATKDKENVSSNPSPQVQAQAQKQSLAQKQPLAQVRAQAQPQQTRKETLPIRAQPAGRTQQTEQANVYDPHGDDEEQRPQIIDYGQGDIYKIYKDYNNDKPLNANVGGNAPKGPKIVYDSTILFVWTI